MPDPTDPKAADHATRANARLASRIVRARNEFDQFLKYIWSNDPDLDLAPFHYEAIEAFTDRSERFVYWEAPRGHGKSLIAVAYICWMLGRDPNERIKIICANDKEARKRLFEIKEQMTKNQLLQLTFPHLKKSTTGGEWNKGRITIDRTIMSKDPSIEAMGVMSGSLGSRATIILFDDIVDLRNSVLQPQLRGHVMTKVFGEIVPLLEANGIIRSLGTPWTICLTPGTYVATDNGGCNIEHVAPDTNVCVAPGVYERPLAQSTHRHIGQVFVVKLAGMPDALTSTSNHPYPTQRGDVLAENLRADDWIRCGGTVTRLSDAEVVAQGPAPLPARVRKQCRPVASPRVSEAEFRAALQAAGGSTYKAAVSLGYSSTYGHTLAATYGVQTLVLGTIDNAKFMLEPEFWWTVGLWVAEGTVARKETYLYLGKSDEELGFAERACEALEMFAGTKTRLKQHHGAWCVVASSAVLSRWLVDNFGHGAGNKRIPSWVERLPEKLQVAFLRGYIDGDGHVRTAKNGAGISTSTVSPDLAHGVVRLLNNMGLAANLYRRTRKQPYVGDRPVKTWRPEHTVMLPRATAATLGFMDPPAEPLAPTCATRWDGSTMWRRVTSIRTRPYNGPVYDLTTSTGYFAVAGCFTHNSDCNHRMKTSAGWRVVGPHRVGNREDRFAPIWPCKFSRDRLVQLHETQGPSEFARAYWCQALTKDTVPVQPGWLKFYNGQLLGDPNKLFCIQTYDLAISQSNEADYFAHTTLLWDERRNYVFVPHAWHERLTFRQQSKRIAREARDWNPQAVVLESGGYQGALEQHLAEDTRNMVDIWPFKTKGRSKERRVVEATPWLEKGRVFFHPKFDPRRNPDIGLTGNIIEELVSFPFFKHDDMVDALCMGLLTLLELQPDQEDRDGDDHDEDEQLGETFAIVL